MKFVIVALALLGFSNYGTEAITAVGTALKCVVDNLSKIEFSKLCNIANAAGCAASTVCGLSSCLTSANPANPKP
ncbi:hypothetical protein FQR65_LT00931 [Abscondita terminalis]|nr:hypothetical protein FQR65_LT00931 [Abscondita terminalis]